MDIDFEKEIVDLSARLGEFKASKKQSVEVN